MNPLLILLLVVGIVVIFIWGLYNGLIRSRLQVKEAWSGIDVQLKRRADLIPNLVETVKGYAKHEKELFENVTAARSSLLKAQNPKDADKANNDLTSALKTIFAVAENYPQLQASQNFKDLQRQLEDTEDKVAYSRQFYNTNVLEYNTKIQLFPNALIAGAFGFTKEEFFGATEEERKNVQVKF